MRSSIFSLMRRTLLAKSDEFDGLYKRYQEATMIPPQTYQDNLALASRILQLRSLDGAAVVECGTWRGGWQRV